MNILKMRYDIKIPMHVLLIIDMQPTWSTSNDAELQERIQDLIRWSMYHGCPIIFLEYRPTGTKGTEWSTQESLIKLVRNEGYDRYKEVPKNKVDGSSQAIEAMACYPVNRLLVTGVDANCCVIDTVAGIAKKQPTTTIEVIRNACRASKPEIYNDESFWKKFSTLDNVRVCTSQATTENPYVFR